MEQVTSDVLGMMMIARDPKTGQGMSDDELRDHVITLMLAGHEVSRHTFHVTITHAPETGASNLSIYSISGTGFRWRFFVK